MPRARYIASAIHAFVFALCWSSFLGHWTPPDMLEGPIQFLMAVTWFADLPISLVAFGMMWSKGSRLYPELIAWGALGTGWWFLLGMSIEAWQKRLAARRARKGIAPAGEDKR